MSAPCEAGSSLQAAASVVLAALVFGCSSAAPPEPSVAPGPSAAGTETPTPAAPSLAGTSSAATPQVAPPSDVVRWADYPGPKLVASFAGPRVWALHPVGGDDWAVTHFVLRELASAPSADAAEHRLRRTSGGDLMVPSSLLLQPPVAKPLAVGAAVIVNVYASYAHARVLEVKDGVKVALRWAGSDAQEQVTLEDTLALDAKLGFGAPVAWKDGAAWTHGFLVSSDAAGAWVLGFGGKPRRVEGAQLVALDLSRKFKVGDRVWAASLSRFEPGKVTKVGADAVSYTIAWDQGEPEVVSFAAVTKPL
jgi:hypothetical protein